MRMMRLVAIAVFALGGLLSAGRAEAAACPSSATVTATAMAFGAINPFALPLNTTSTLTLKYTTGGTACSETAVVTMSAGGGSGATVANRLMTGSGHTLSYTIYTPPGPPTLTVWDNTTGYTCPTVTVPKNTTTTQTVTAYGTILSPQTSIFPASYTDTVTITLTF